MSFKIYLAKTRGMCAGVDRAIRVVNLALERYGAGKVWVLHEVVHNHHVVQDLKNKGAVFVESLSEIPDGSVVIFSAHGVGIATFNEAKERHLTIIDATCPLVSRIHRKMNRAGLEGKDAVVIGHAGHQEVTGTIGQYMGDSSKVHVILTPEDVAALNISGNAAIFATQTTLSVDETAKTVAALKERFPHIEGPKTDDTCFATQHRQGAVKKLAQICDVVLVAGSKNSSNSNRLREVAASCGAQAYLVEDHLELQSKWFDGIKAVGLTAGASVPEYVVDGILKFLREKSNCDVEEIGEAPVKRSFALPQGV